MKIFAFHVGLSKSARRAFTLIELLASMAILAIIVLMVSRLFADTSKIWQLGAKRVESNTDGRVLVDVMARELSGMIADDTLTFYQDSDDRGVDILGRRPDAIYFVCNDNDTLGSGDRQMMQVSYYIDEMKNYASNADLTNRFLIRRQQDAGAPQAYTNSTWYNLATMKQGNQELADNVRTMEFWVYDAAGDYHANYLSSVYGPPAWIEIYVEMLGEDDSIRVAALASPGTAGAMAAAVAYADRMAKRYVGRVYLNHAVGHAKDK